MAAVSACDDKDVEKAVAAASNPGQPATAWEGSAGGPVSTQTSTASAAEPVARPPVRNSLQSNQSRQSQSGLGAFICTNDQLNELYRHPNAADQLGLDVLIGFRRKLFATLIIQISFVLVLAWGFANLPPIKEMRLLYNVDKNLVRDGLVVGILLLVTLIALGLTAAYRAVYPYNIICVSIFSVLMSCFLGAFVGPNVHLGCALMLGGITLIAIPTCIRLGNQVIEVFPVACFVTVINLTVGIIWQTNYNNVMELHWFIIAIIFIVFATLWFGFELDRLCSTVQVDEFLTPVVQLWCEFVVMIILILSLQACLAGGTAAGGGGMDFGCKDCLIGCSYSTAHCRCCIYNDGSHGRDAFTTRRNIRRSSRSSRSSLNSQNSNQPQIVGNSGAPGQMSMGAPAVASP